MIRSNDDFTPENIDEQIERFLQLRGPQQQAPSVALAQALKAVCEEDVASLKRVRERYVACLQALPVSNAQSSASLSSSFLQRKERTMHDLQEKKEPVFIQPPAPRKTGRKQYLGMIAALLCVAVLVGSFLTLINMARTNRTTGVGSQMVVTPTPQPTSSFDSHAIQKAFLTASNTGSSEGVGPGLSGLVPTDHFTVGQQFWLVFIVNNSGGGTVTAKWYANGRLYRSSSDYLPYTYVPKPSQGRIPPTPGLQRKPTPTPGPAASPVPVEDNFSITYDQPTAGKVELYWKGRLAMTLFFVVKPKA